VTDDYIASQLLIAGTVPEVVDRLSLFREHVDPFEWLLFAGHDWAEPERCAARWS
jgi:hypothetical protein